MLLRPRRLLSLLVVACAALAAIGARVAIGLGADPYHVEVVQTSADLSQRLTRLPDAEFGRLPVAAGEPVIRVDAARGYQRVQGFGAAMTDSSAWLLERALPPAATQAAMSSLFGPAGIGLDYVKVPIGASDFAHDGRPYTYDDLAPGQSDPALRHFSIAHDEAYILPALRQARALDRSLRLLATPWTPPAWMKTNDSLGNGGNRGSLRPADYGPWAAYFVRFLRAYAAAGAPVSAVTAQNEPGIGTLYPGLNLSAGAEATWIARYLAPALARARLRVAVYGGDLGWGPTTGYFAALARSSAAGRMAGLAWHCYYGAPTVMSAFHALRPHWGEIVDECSPGLITPTPIPEIAISSLRNWATAVFLWNLALDPTGGPAELPNHGCMGCQGLLTIDPVRRTVTKGPAYYQIGQLSAFVRAGAQRVASGNFVSYTYPHSGVNVVTPGLDDVALRNPDGSLVLVAYDNSRHAVRFAVAWRGRRLQYTLAPGSTVTLIWNRPG